MDEDEVIVTITGVRSHHGSIVRLDGVTDDGQHVVIAADHRPAQDIIEALEAGEEVITAAPLWAVSFLAGA